MDSFPWTFMNSRILLQLGSLDPWIQPWILSSPNALTGLQLTQEGPLCRSLDFSLCSTLSSAAGCLGFPGLSLVLIPSAQGGCRLPGFPPAALRPGNGSHTSDSPHLFPVLGDHCALLPDTQRLEKGSLCMFCLFCWFQVGE